MARPKPVGGTWDEVSRPSSRPGRRWAGTALAVTVAEMPAVTRRTELPGAPGPVHVLIASGDRVFASHLCACLAAEAMTVTLWEAPATGPLPDLAGVDVLLIETFGLGEAQRELLDTLHEAAPLVEVVAISEDPAVENAVQALRAGVFAILEYPVSSDVIAREITRACERKRRAERRIRQLDDQGRWGEAAARPAAGGDGSIDSEAGTKGREH